MIQKINEIIDLKLHIELEYVNNNNITNILEDFFKETVSLGEREFSTINFSNSLISDMLILENFILTLSETKNDNFFKKSLSSFINDIELFDHSYVKILRPKFEKIFKSNNNIYGKIILFKWFDNRVQKIFDQNTIKLFNIQDIYQNLIKIKIRMDKEGLDFLGDVYEKTLNDKEYLELYYRAEPLNLILSLNSQIYLSNMHEDPDFLFVELLEKILDETLLHELTSIDLLELNSIIKNFSNERMSEIMSNTSLYSNDAKNNIITSLIDERELVSSPLEFINLADNYKGIHDNLIKSLLLLDRIDDMQIVHLKELSNYMTFNNEILFNLLSLYKTSGNRNFVDIILNINSDNLLEDLNINTIKLSLMLLDPHDFIKLFKNIELLNHIFDETKSFNKFNLTKNLIDLFIIEFNNLSDVQKKIFSDLINTKSNITKEQVLKIIILPIDKYFKGLIFLSREVIQSLDVSEEYIIFLENYILELIKREDLNKTELMRYLFKYVELGGDLNNFKNKANIIVFIIINYSLSKDPLINEILEEYKIDLNQSISFQGRDVSIFDLAEEVLRIHPDSNLLNILNKNNNQNIINKISQEYN